jgi:hypothetical protein
VYYYVTGSVTNSVEQSSSWETDSHSAGSWSRNSSPFMERGSSLPCSQESASGPCPEPD